MKRRWFIYIITGIMFGVFDFYYHGFLSNFLGLQQVTKLAGRIAWVVLSIGIWLVPIIPIILYEAKFSRSRVLSALASSLTWCASIISYYLTNAIQLAFLGFPTRPELHVSNHNDPFFFENWKSIILHDILEGIVEWSVVAVIGGIIIGFLISFIYLHLRETHQSKKVSQINNSIIK